MNRNHEVEMTELEKGGVQAIIELCAANGEVETPERALKNWRAFSPKERTMTLVCHLAMCCADMLKKMRDQRDTEDGGNPKLN